MAQRPKFVVDMQYLFGEALIKTGVASLWLIALAALFMPTPLRTAIAEAPGGLAVMTLAMFAVALGLWQWGRALRRAATIADRGLPD